jgi:hypothetical protein
MRSSASCQPIGRKWLSSGPAATGSTRRPAASSSRGENARSFSRLKSSKKCSRTRPCMSAAIAWIDFLHTSGKRPSSFTMPPRCPPIPSAQVLHALRVRSAR